MIGIAALLALACGEPPRVTLPPADPERPPGEGLSRLATASLDAFLAASARLGFQAGYVALFARDGHVVHGTASGWADREAGLPMSLDTRFRIASMTKPVTAVAALLLMEEGRLDLDDPVSRTVPAAGSLVVASRHDRNESGRIPTRPLEEPLRVRHLLTFTSGIGARDDRSTDLGRLWARHDLYAGRGSLAQRVERILRAPLYEPPGQRWRYGWSADVLARAVEVAAGEPFGRFVERRILEPLGMDHTGFLPPEDRRAGMARVYTQDGAGDLVPVATPASDAPHWTPGGSGLVSTAPDFLRFALMLWNRGSYDGVRLLSEETVDRMVTPHVREGVLAEEGIEGLGWGLGLAVVVDADATPTSDRDGDFWWSGYYGTTFFVSPSTGLVGVVMAQNQPSEHSPRPIPVYLAQAFAFFGL